jgi:hypothetical protein
MRILQNKFVPSLPKVILFLITFYNFIWAYWQTLDSMAGRGIVSPWYSTKDFPIAQFLLLLAAYLLFIPRIWSYSISVLTSGYFAVSWMWMIVNWFLTTDYSLSYRIEIITSQYFGHPLQIWEIQAVIASLIFAISCYYFVKEIVRSQKQTDFVLS